MVWALYTLGIWPILERQVEKAIERWRHPDRAIWEVRGEPRHFVSSKVFCWVACDRGSRLAEVREHWEKVERWRAAADEIQADILEHGVDDRGVFVQHYDTTALDAALLLIRPTGRATCASACSAWPARSGFTPRTSTHTPAVISATSRRHSPTSRSSTR